MRAKTADKIERLRACAADGLTQAEAARKLGILPVTVSQLKKRAAIVFVSCGRGIARKTSDSRADAMAKLYRSGATLKQIGDQYGITRERVRQLISRYHGLSRKDGGMAVEAERKAVEKAADRDAKYLAKKGCTFSQWQTLYRLGRRMVAQGLGEYRTPLRAFLQQRSNANIRGIPWDLTLWQWWTIWEQSGHWNDRGRGYGYCMARRGDTGPYAVWNVSITTSRANTSQGTKTVNTHLPMGVRPSRSGSRFIACWQVDGKRRRSATFDTPEAAHAAYLSAIAAMGAAA